jgi:hypothetical protein
MGERVCAGLALAASYWRVPAAALGNQAGAGGESGDPAVAAAIRTRCARPTYQRSRPPRGQRIRRPEAGR